MTFWQPGARGPGLAVEESSSGGGGAALIFNPMMSKFSLEDQRAMLPVAKHRDEFLFLVERHRVVIVLGETGSGKSTQLPQFLVESGWAAQGNCVAVTQPRRIAAMSLATRIASERGVVLGKEVGYAVRFENLCEDKVTQIKLLTDGMLLREAMGDPRFSRYSVIMLDEVHERSLSTDILLGLLKRVMRERPELRLIVSSATADYQGISRFFGPENTGALCVEGRMYPVDVLYLSRPTSDYVAAAVTTVEKIHRTEPPGDVLVFLTGQDEVDRAVQQLAELNLSGMTVVPLYAGLPTEYHMAIFEPRTDRARKVIVATNIAETSVTIPGIVYVVDSGMVKIRIHDASTSTDALVVVPTSRSSMIQRAGRAGRLKSGKCFRLLTESDYMTSGLVPEHMVPEIQRSDLIDVVLQLQGLGIGNVAEFESPSPVSRLGLCRALETLHVLGACSEQGKITTHGIDLAHFPVDPRSAHVLLRAKKHKCREEILTIVAMLAAPSIFTYVPGSRTLPAELLEKDYSVLEGDHLTFLNIFEAYQQQTRARDKWCRQYQLNEKSLQKAAMIRKQLDVYLEQAQSAASRKGKAQGGDDGDEFDHEDEKASAIRKCLLSGFFSNVAVLKPDEAGTGGAKNVYRTVRGNKQVFIHPQSVLFRYAPGLVMFSSTIRLKGKTFLSNVSAIEESWLIEIAPHFYQTHSSKRRK